MVFVQKRKYNQKLKIKLELHNLNIKFRFATIVKNSIIVILTTCILIFFAQKKINIHTISHEIEHTFKSLTLVNPKPDIQIQHVLQKPPNTSTLITNDNKKKLYQAVTSFHNQMLQDTVFVSQPKIYTNNNKPTIIFYIHGQDEFITNNISNNPKFKTKLLNWGNFFATNNYIFIAPNLNNNNWGNSSSLQLLIEEIKYYTKLYSAKQVQIVGYSMGGLLSYKLLVSHPELISKAQIIAGTLPLEILNKQSCSKLNQTVVIIHHGLKDVNVPLNQSSKLIVDTCHSFAFKYPKLITYPNYDHWQLGYMQEPNFLIKN